MTKLTLFAVSDIHGVIDFLPSVAELAGQADLVLVLGDLTQFGHKRHARSVVNAFKQHNSNLLAVPGNMDHRDVLEFLEDEGISIHGRYRKINGVGIAGLGASNPTPFNTPFEMTEDEIYDTLCLPVKAMAGIRRRIIVSHCPPKNTLVDRVRTGLHVGSSAVRRIIEEYQPDLLLCGHIHEARGEDTIGRTRIINPGPLSNGGFVWVEIEDSEIRAEIRLADNT